ncbi:aminotransferase class IV [Labilibaculum sp. DW002]|jgi:branched-chain amino acid aminotransferase|uniref:branched-chain-amino-acid transaminase n=1 Tax=Paralabilibaculum antarcticum TaxID=2912572 RepID=A0ABT5W103_9BACT|nr:aminotransferase class IV [Labilibaculum sp. DW002]MDE5420508.1 aminotransferase class IV [Labilibaculum sp. DW002]
MSECYRYIFLKNEKLKPSKEFKDEFLLRGSALYEVIRVVSGKPVFLKDHFQRLSNSAIQIKEQIWYTFNQIEDQIEKLIQINDVQNGNIKLVFHIDGLDKNFFVYFIKHYYPKPEQYLNGVRTIVHHAERPLPNAKVYNHSLRSKTNDIIRDAEIFEVLLLNSVGNLTEGSRSNLFFIKNNELHTAYDSEVLNGIVRSKVLEIAERLNIPIRKSHLKYDDLAKYDAAFLTGTSLMILPIKKINSISFSPSHEIINSLSEGFNKLISDYLQ